MKKLLLIMLSALCFSMPAWATVDINAASQAQLQELKGVGPKKAQAIIEYRKKNGPFKSAGDLDKVPGFGAKTVEALKKDITVGNATAATAGKPDKVAKDAKLASPIDTKDKAKK
ncbi:MAG TPA: helix-hairpin-helix domain-containing protein [Methylophilaceae bacterium]|nr:helix-hairpin-helix domain-containing protein [Methylophilaceae bacterium]